jgi:hypothetical protein
MPSTHSTPFVSRARLLGAFLIAVLTAAFNYGSQVQTLADAATWLAVGIVVGYPTLTVMSLLEDRIWA